MTCAELDHSLDAGMLAEALWQHYRARADRVLDLQMPSLAGAKDGAVRGALYVLAADLAAEWVDRIEREADPERRAALVSALLPPGPGRSPAAEV